MNKLVIIGAGGHGRVVADIARLNGYNDIIFLDDANDIDRVKVSGTVADYKNYICGCDFIVAIGNNKTRESITEKLIKEKANVVTLVHPKAVVCKDATLKVGSVVAAGAVVCTGAVVGKGAIINTASSVDHDSTVGDYSHISVGARISGTVNVGKNVFVGAGATIINNVSVADNCVIGAGAVVIKDIVEQGVYVGVPSKKIK